MFFLCFPHFANSQNQIDSLKSVFLQTDKKDTSAQRVLYLIGNAHQKAFELDSALVWYQKIIELNLPQNNKYYLDAIKGKGACYYYSRNFAEAIKTAEKGLSLSDKSEYKGRYYNIISVSYMDMGNLTKAIEIAQKAHAEFKKSGDSKGEGAVLNNIGNIHFDSNNFEDAIEYYKQSIKVYKRSNNFHQLPGPINGLGIALMETVQLDLAAPYFEESIRIADSLKQWTNKAMAINNLGLIYYKKKEYDTAITYFNEAHSLYEDTEDIGGIADVSGDIGILQLKLKNYKSALNFCKKSYEINESDSYFEGMVENCNCLYLAHKGLGNLGKALAYHEKWKISSDSLFSASKTRELTKANMSFEYENEKKITALEQKQKEDALIYKNQQTRTAALGIGAFALIVLFFFYNARRKNKLISAQKEQLETLNHTKDRIFAIIGHDLRKPAASFRGISKKVKYLIQNQDFATLDKFGLQIEEDAHALSKLTDNLLSWALTQRDVMPYNPATLQVDYFVADIKAIFKTPAHEKSIQIVNNVPKGVTVFADANALSTILTNLVDNAIKYTPEGGQIRIEALEDVNNQLKIRVADTGIGMEKDKINDLFLLKKDKSEDGTSGEKGTGLGLHLVKELVKLNNGIISVVSEIGKGTSFDILLPKYAME